MPSISSFAARTGLRRLGRVIRKQARYSFVRSVRGRGSVCVMREKVREVKGGI